MSRFPRSRALAAAGLAAAIAVAATARAGAVLRGGPLQTAIEAIAHKSDGRFGACVRDAATIACINGSTPYPLQSVVKLFVAIAVMDAVDRRAIGFNDPITVYRKDLSVGVQPIADLIGPDGYKTTIGDLVRRAIVDSDSAATDVLIATLGGTKAVQDVLVRKDAYGVRIDRDERHLQTETMGLTWKPQYVDAKRLDKARAGVPEDKRDAAFRAYQKDVRDTATPEGMVALLEALDDGRLLSPESTTMLLGILEQTTTFPDRLKAGLAEGWRIAHKTGTSGSWRGVTAATNDVGILAAPNGDTIAVAVFIADSHASSEARGALIADVTRAAIANYAVR